MLFLVAALALLAAVIGPGLWVRRVMARYSEPRDRYPGTGGELARHLLDGLGLGAVRVEASESGDHYDPEVRVVRLTPDKLDGRSLTAIAVAAHEVGHAHQHATGYAPLRWRTRLARLAAPGQRLGAAVLMLAPAVMVATRAPGLGVVMFVGGFLAIGLTALVHLVTLPTELDASFGRALPLLRGADVLLPGDEPHARRLLRAAALTYVAASLASLLSVARWWQILRR